MKINAEYLKTYISGVPYLMPYGQSSANHARSLRLNESGAFLWDALADGADTQELLSLLSQHYEVSADEVPQLREDIRQFLSTLAAIGIITFSDNREERSSIAPLYMQIGPFTLCYHGPEVLYDNYFSAFACREQPADQTIILRTGNPRVLKNGTILVRTSELTICDCGDDYLFLFNEIWGIHEMCVKKDGSTAVLYCIPDVCEQHAEDVFHALRFAFLILAQNHDIHAVHSASILYRDRAWLFSGPSGMGKSTHTALWHEQYQVPLLNGDLNLIGIEDGTAVVYGLPWCGTSEIYTKENYPLGGIVFLRRAFDNTVTVPPADDQGLNLAQRLISPAWSPAQLESNIRFCEKVTQTVPVLELHCTKEPAAAAVMKSAIDQQI